MEIKEKENIVLIPESMTDNSYILRSLDDGYSYVLPFKKARFDSQHVPLVVEAFIEKIDGSSVYLSQVHWLFMRNIIEKRLSLDVKIKKRHPGKVTVAQLRVPGQYIDIIAVKALSKEMQEKIYIKPAKN
jgi:hypothetical protein